MMRRFRALPALVSSVAVAFMAAPLALGATRFQVSAAGEVPGFAATEVPDEIIKKLAAAGWSRVEGAANVTLDLKVMVGHPSCGQQACAAMTTQWWDGATRSVSGLCVSSPPSLTCTLPIQKRDILERIVAPIVDEALREDRSRWTAHLANLDPGDRTDLDVRVGDMSADDRIDWSNSDGSPSIGSGKNVSARYRKCQAELTAASPTLDLSELAGARSFAPRWTIDDDPVDKITHAKDEPFTLGLALVPAPNDPITLPCAGKVSATIDASPTEYSATPIAVEESMRWAWKVTMKSEDGLIVARLTSADAIDAAVSSSVPFTVPYWRKLWVGALSLAAGIVVLGNAAKAVRGAFTRSKPDDDEDEGAEGEEKTSKAEKADPAVEPTADAGEGAERASPDAQPNHTAEK